MKRVAYFEPVRGLDVYGRELLPHLAHYYDIDVFTDARHDALVPDVAQGFPLRHFDDSRRRNSYAHLIFHLRNNAAHAPVYDQLMVLGGVSVFHDVNISGIIGGKTLARGQRWEFLNELRRVEGPSAFARSSVDVLLRKRWPAPDQYTMNKAACQRSRGIIVHNRQAQRALARVAPGVPIAVVGRGVPEADNVDPIAARRRLGVPQDVFLVVSLGVVAERKRIPQALVAFTRLRDRVPNARYVLVGKSEPDFDAHGIIQQLGLEKRVEVTGWVAEDLFYDYLDASDVCVCLRYPVEGETSSVALRAMSYAKPTLVSASGSMREWPDDICIKIKPNREEIAAIYEALYELSQDTGFRRRLGERARSYTRSHHTWEAAAQAYSTFLEGLGDQA